MKLTIEFGGGLEALVKNGQKTLQVDLQRDEMTVQELIEYIAETFIVSRQNLFYNVDLSKLKPGILVLINDCDWELKGASQAVVQNEDVISFISTLHGG
ncbi:uncharacterized protein LOC128882889 [Hylaeus volcanicus]|uniref:uncharacterized protein LOC128882889 n=1 Tax=Hylaeus volcanicus TaxID=313075 RepID=UPI0023B8305D|nr:uncharacterized protein LOC128882889 [Hylaeus volcanicus]